MHDQRRHRYSPREDPGRGSGVAGHRYDEVKALLADQRLGRSHPDPTLRPRRDILTGGLQTLPVTWST
jgi:hypothetical protein